MGSLFPLGGLIGFQKALTLPCTYSCVEGGVIKGSLGKAKWELMTGILNTSLNLNVQSLGVSRVIIL